MYICIYIYIYIYILLHKIIMEQSMEINDLQID